MPGLNDRLVVIRGGGDLATGVVWRLATAGVGVIVTELPEPLTIRRRVALSSAVLDGSVRVQTMTGELVSSFDAAISGLRTRSAAHAGPWVPVVVAPALPPNVAAYGIDAVVDARLAKRRLDTMITDAAVVVGLGPGFVVGVDCHAVVETMRGHNLGRVLWAGSAIADTGIPGEVGGRSGDRVLRAPVPGSVRWTKSIGDIVEEGEVLGTIATEVIAAPFRGVIRGLISMGTPVWTGLKIADIDPRCDVDTVHTISDKALAVGGGVLEALLTHWNAQHPQAQTR